MLSGYYDWQKKMQRAQGPISRTDLSLVSYPFVLDLSAKTDLSLLVKLAPGK